MYVSGLAIFSVNYLGERLAFIPEIDSFNIFLWFALTMPFGPLLLDLHGF
jgi:hypothetical protein